MGAKHGPLSERFWRKVDKSGLCWLWTANCDTSGYGQIQDGTGHLQRAHRLSYEWHHGPIPPGLSVLHRCDVRRCVNPAHLFLGTRADNAADMVAKGRAASGNRNTSRVYPGIHRQGEQHPLAKLNSAKVREIRQRAAGGESQRSIARAYQVGKGTVQAILQGRSWADVT